jgi:hypothetical protein
MARTERYEEHGSVSKVSCADFLRVLTVERFTVWKPPASTTDRAAPLGHPRTKASGLNTSDVLNVPGQVRDDTKNGKPGRVR